MLSTSGAMQSFRSRPRRRRSRSATPPPPIASFPPPALPPPTVPAASLQQPHLVGANASSSDGEFEVPSPRPRRQNGAGGYASDYSSARRTRGSRERAATATPRPTKRHGRREKTRAELQAFAWAEGRAAAIGTASACALRAAVAVLAALAASGVVVVDGSDADAWGVVPTFVARVGRPMSSLLTALAGPLLALLPSKAARGASPGFAFAAPLVLRRVRQGPGVLSPPNIPCRVAETLVGRLTPRELAVVIPVHFLGAIAGAALAKVLLPSAYGLSNHAVDPIIYSEGHAWLYDLAKEVVVNAFFTVIVLVLPQLLRLNRLPCPGLLTLLALYPLFNAAVGASGTASAFGPDVVYALRCVTRREEVPIGQSQHMIGPILGGVVGGKIMTWFFPDE